VLDPEPELEPEPKPEPKPEPELEPVLDPEPEPEPELEPEPKPEPELEPKPEPELEPEPEPIILEEELEPYRITWTIKNYYSNTFAPISQAEQEATVQQAFEHWTQHINAEVIFVKNADPKDVFCTVDFKPLRHIGGGGGDGPNTWCVVDIGSNQHLYVGEKPESTYVHRSLLAIAAHEGGHGLGLTHKNVGSCMMFTNYGDGISQCDVEVAELQTLWKDAVNPPDSPLLDGSMKEFFAEQTYVRFGDTARLHFTIENIGNLDYNSIVWFFDKTDNIVIRSGPFYRLDPGETAIGFVDWDTGMIGTEASIGVHEIQGHWLADTNDVNKANNFITIFVTVHDPT